MTRRALAILAALAALGGVTAIVVVATSGGGSATLAPSPGDAVIVKTTVSPARFQFGDRTVAELELTVDESRVDPADIVVGAFFRPFRRVGAIETTRIDLGTTTVLEYRYPIQCIDRGCAPTVGLKELELPIGLVRYTPREGDVVSLPLTWPEVGVSTRLSPEQTLDVRARPGILALDGATSDPPPVAYDVDPTVIGWLFSGAAAALLLGLGAFFARRLWGRRARRAAVEPERRVLAPLHAALAALERAGVDADRRRALDELALELAERGRTELAHDARRLAWSQAGPQPPETERLVAEVRRSVEEAA